MPANCTNCPNKAFPRIPASRVFEADFAVVGEAADNSEIANKKAFQGYKGNMVRKCLEVAGLTDTSKVFFTNALLCRPPVGKPINQQAVRNCKDRLLDELAQVNPKVIMALGNTPIQVLTANSKAKITHEHGRALRSPDLPGVPVIANWHPGKVARAPGDYKTFISATQYAVQTLKTGNVKEPPPSKFEIVDTDERLKEVVPFLALHTLVAADIETGGFNPRRDKTLALGICYQPGQSFIFPSHMIPKLKVLFQIDSIKWIWHNGKFDTAFLRKYGLRATVHHDTILLHYSLNETSGTHDLGQLASQLLGAPNYKMSVKGYATAKESGYANVPPEILNPYLAKDVDYTFQIFHILYPRVCANPDLSKLYHELLIPASSFLQRMERNGMWTNIDSLEELRIRFLGEIEDVTNGIAEITAGMWNPERYVHDTGAKTAPAVFNPGSTKQLAWLLYDKMKLKPLKRGNRSTDEDHIIGYAGQHPFVDLILERRSLKKMLKTYVESVIKVRDDQGRIHSTFALHITATGRLSSRGPNVQNVKSDPQIKGIYQAAKGKILIEADYKAAELRVLADISGDVVLRQVFLDERDLHDEVAIKFFGPNFTRDDRMKAKTVNFGIPYGRTAQSLAEEFGIATREGQRMIDEWAELFPQAWAYLVSCDRAVLKGEVLVTPFGRHRRFGLVTADMLGGLQNEARNFRIQSISSDLTLSSAMALEKELDLVYGGKIINLIHDAILIEVDNIPHVIEAVARLLVTTMNRVPIDKLGTDVPFVTDLKVGPMWGSTKKYELTEVA